MGPDTGSFRVIRGGTWFIPAGLCRSAGRFDTGPGSRFLGFRASLVPADKWAERAKPERSLRQSPRAEWGRMCWTWTDGQATV